MKKLLLSLFAASMLLLTAAAEEPKKKAPKRRTPTAPTGQPTPAPAQAEDKKRYQQPGQVPEEQLVEPVPAPVTTPAPAIIPAAVPAVVPAAIPAPGGAPAPGLGQSQALPPVTNGLAPLIGEPPRPLEPPLGSELRGKLKADEQHFAEKTSAAKLVFVARQAEERKSFEATSKNAGYWDRRRLRRKFLATQAAELRAFNDEQEQKRRTYEWRYP